MISTETIRERLLSYLRQEIDLEQFEDWIAQNSWNAHLSSDLPAQRLANSIELKLAEHSSGHLSESKMRRELLPLLIPYLALPLIKTESTTVFSPAPWQMRPAGTQPSKASWSPTPA
jgi:hypothetical protein